MAATDNARLATALEDIARSFADLSTGTPTAYPLQGETFGIIADALGSNAANIEEAGRRIANGLGQIADAILAHKDALLILADNLTDKE